MEEDIRDISLIIDTLSETVEVAVPSENGGALLIVEIQIDVFSQFMKDYVENEKKRNTIILRSLPARIDLQHCTYRDQKQKPKLTVIRGGKRLEDNTSH